MAEWGYVRISRKAYAKDQWWNEPRVFSKWEAWEDCIQMAAWQPYKRLAGAAVEVVNRGEFIASIRFLATRWRWGIQHTRTFLKLAQQSARLLAQRETHLGTLYLLVNYGAYQGDGPPGNTPANTVPNTQNGKHPTQQPAQIETTKQIRTKRTTSSPHGDWVPEAVDIYAKHIGYVAHGIAGRMLKPVVDRRGWPEVKTVLECFCELSPYQEYLQRCESGTLRPNEEKVKKLGYNTKLSTFVETYTHWAEMVGVTT